MSKYLYGAAVQGIQNYIFQTNKLRDIVGASEQVELICTERFKNFVKSVTGRYNEDAVVIQAAGNIKYAFESKVDCEKVVKSWPKNVLEYAPGITISQAVVEYDESCDFGDVVNELERRLRSQRNKPMTDTTVGLMGIHRSRTTNMPAIEIEKGTKNGYLDIATFNKLYHRAWDDSTHYWRKRTTRTLCEKAFGMHNINFAQIAFDTEKMTDKNDWIAVIHADGNGLGKIVQSVGHDRKKFKEFSQNLDVATKQAAVSAYHTVESMFEGIIPIRPIVLGGDDFSVICRADIALPYVEAFIRAFEEETDARGYKLTACAGIAYIKSSFPFYYGYELAESLCTAAKKDAKKKDEDSAPSCIMFHKVQDSFVENYQDMVSRELTPLAGISLQYGPYYLQEQEDRWTISQLKSSAGQIADDCWNPIKSALRQWLTLLNENTDKASQKLKRILEVCGNEEQRIFVRRMTEARLAENGSKCYPVYDVLALHTLTTQETRQKEEEQK